jgi:GTP cyclohydrolase II
MNYRGPIKWPIQVDGAETKEWELHYFETENDRYIVGTIGDIEQQPVPVRIESACIFGHVFFGIKCDCGEQFELALRRMLKEEHGVVIYALDDDARGYGVEMHFKLYELRQHENRMDEREIFDELGLELDARDYGPVVDILEKFEVEEVKLMTNNPDRVHALETGGITVTERIPIEAKIHEYNERLLLQEKEWLDYDAEYKTHEEWINEFENRIKSAEGRFGVMITLDHTDIAEVAFADSPSDIAIDIDENNKFRTLYVNFSPSDKLLSLVDKVIEVTDDGWKTGETDVRKTIKTRSGN